MAEGEIKFKANAVNEEDSELQKTKPPYASEERRERRKLSRTTNQS